MPFEELATIIPDVACVLLCAVAAAVDLRRYKIPNWLTGWGAAAGLALNVALATAAGGVAVGLRDGGGDALLGGGFLLLVSGVLGGLRLVGMGDVKLLGAVGLFVGWPLAAHVLLYTVLAGGVVSVGIAFGRGVLPQVLANIGQWKRDSPPTQRVHRMPYGLAIFAGTSWAVLSRYLPELQLV